MKPHRAPAFRVLLGRVVPLFLLLVSAPSFAQYVFLDANGDGMNDSSDHLNATGPTDLDVWFVTDHNRDGSPAVCSTDPSSPMTINSYEIVLLSQNGTVRFGPMQNLLQFTGTPTSFASYEDTTSTSAYHNGWGFRDILPPGRYKVATLRVEVLGGTPSLVFAGHRPGQPTDLTSFGTKCDGIDFDNTATLGEEFQDAAGIGPLVAMAGGPYHGVVGFNVYFSSNGSTNPDGTALTFAWDFGDGQTGIGATAVHAYAEPGTYTATLTVSSGSASAVSQATVTVIADTTPRTPVADAGGPYTGRASVPVGFDGGNSFDPEGKGLVYVWDFGDDQRATGQRPLHTYAEAGTYTVRLEVSDGTNQSTDETTCTVAAPPQPNRAPIASAGGPYAGIVGRWIQFNATQSSDPDADAVTVTWDFGDNVRGIGPVAAHAYTAVGTYTVRAFVSDYALTSEATTQAVVTNAFEANAFFDGGKKNVDLDDAHEDVIVLFQPANGSFTGVDVDPDRVDLSVEVPNGEVRVLGASRSAIEAGDQDEDGVTEFAVAFSRAALAALVDEEEIHGKTNLVLTVGLHRGGDAVAPFDAVFAHGHGPHLAITPNPFNPAAVVVIQSTLPGRVSAKLYDVRGRLVRTVLSNEHVTAGRHDFALEAIDDRGIHLSSGVYFLQVNGPDGASTKRVVIAK